MLQKSWKAGGKNKSTELKWKHAVSPDFIGVNWQVSERHSAARCKFQVVSLWFLGLNWTLESNANKVFVLPRGEVVEHRCVWLADQPIGSRKSCDFKITSSDFLLLRLLWMAVWKNI